MSRRLRYIGPRNQLRGKTCITWEHQPPPARGYTMVQFNDARLTVAGVPMGHGWHFIKTQYLRDEQS